MRRFFAALLGLLIGYLPLAAFFESCHAAV
jgi:hypothetical protein